MLVEHSFVTTKEGTHALEVAQGTLKHMGFKIEEVSDAHVVASRGVRNPASAKKLSQLPQRVELNFDRGRLSMAALVKELRRPHQLTRELLLALPTALELSVTQDVEVGECCASWDQVHVKIDALRAKQFKRNCVYVGLFCLIVILPLGMLVYRELYG